MIRKCINGCLVYKGRHYQSGKGTPEWTEEEMEIEILASKTLTQEGSLKS